MRTSARTFLIGLIGLGVIAVVRTIVVVGAGDPEVIALASETLIVFACFVIILYSSHQLQGERFGRVWRLIGWGMLFYALGDLTLVVMMLTGMEVSYPSPADVPFVLYYAFMGLAVLIPSIEMRRIKEAQNAALVAGLAGAVASLLLYFGLIEPVLTTAGLSTAGIVLTSTYLLADVCLLAMPAVFVLMLISQSADRRQLLPWFYVATGLIVMAAADIAYASMMAHGTYVAGAIIDFGWMLATLSLAVGASLTMDAAGAYSSSGQDVPERVVSKRASGSSSLNADELKPR